MRRVVLAEVHPTAPRDTMLLEHDLPELASPRPGSALLVRVWVNFAYWQLRFLWYE